MQKFKPEHKDQMFLLPPSVEEFVPENHLARLIEGIVDELDCSSIEAKYSELGQKSYSPQLLLKLWIYSYSIGVYSGRKIASKCETDLAYLYLACMYRPDFRTINDFRKDNIDFFNKAFLDVLHISSELGLAQIGTLAIDGTKIRANAASSRTKDKEGFEKWKANIEKTIQTLHEKADKINAEEDERFGNTRGDQLNKKIGSKIQLKIKIEKILKKYEDEKLDAKQKINLTDEEANLMLCDGRIKPNYNCQGSVNMEGVLIGQYASTSGSDKEQLIPIVEMVQENMQTQPENILADSGYASYDSYEKINEKGIVAYMPDQQYENSIRHADKIDPYDRRNFKYDSEKDLYICPQGKELHYKRDYFNKVYKQKSRIYKSKDCPECLFRSRCTNGKYRSINREDREYLKQQARDRLDTPQGKEIYQQRMCTIEPVWGNIKFNRKFLMFSLRGKTKVNGEFSLVCLANNILKIKKMFDESQAA